MPKAHPGTTGVRADERGSEALHGWRCPNGWGGCGAPSLRTRHGPIQSPRPPCTAAPTLPAARPARLPHHCLHHRPTARRSSCSSRASSKNRSAESCLWHANLLSRPQPGALIRMGITARNALGMSVCHPLPAVPFHRPWAGLAGSECRLLSDSTESTLRSDSSDGTRPRYAAGAAWEAPDLEISTPAKLAWQLGAVRVRRAMLPFRRRLPGGRRRAAAAAGPARAGRTRTDLRCCYRRRLRTVSRSS